MKSVLVGIALSTTLSTPVLAEKVTPQEAVTALESKFGVFKGERRNHTKGLCFSASFTATNEAQKYTKSAIFTGDTIPVIGRFSHAGGNIMADDTSGRVFGMALRFEANNAYHNMAMLNLPFFPVPSPNAFVDRLKISSDQDKRDFALKYPSSQHLEEIVSTRNNEQSDYSEHYYNSIHTFYFENVEGKKVPARWIFYPTTNSTLEKPLNGELKDFQASLLAKLEKHPIGFDMIVSFPHKTDALTNPTVPWVTSGERVNFGRLNIENLNTKCESLNYDPLVLTTGITPSNDEVLKFRSGAYAISFGKRLSEK
ncbi:MAG: hypothetical protein AXW14_02600 [Alteromonas sp. Nap_26]|nr:MAG: hypothetical protein AXW14_02600 [Alteromonas sp. Nap_26]